MSLATNPPSTASAPPSVSARQNLKRSVQQAFEGSHHTFLTSFIGIRTLAFRVAAFYHFQGRKIFSQASLAPVGQ